MSTDTVLSLSSIPFKQEVFHTFTGGAKARTLKCDAYDAQNVTPEIADQLIAQLAGLEQIKEKIKGLSTARVDLFRLAVKAALARSKNKQGAASHVTASRRNIILQGPTGVGKTITAQVTAINLVAHKLVELPKIVMVKGLDLRGEFQGETNVVINKALEFARKGVLILDEIDALSSYDNTSFDVEAINHLNASMEAESKAGTVVIMTGYPKGIDALFSDQPGLRERFPSIWEISQYTSFEACQVFDKKIELEGLQIESAARDLAHREMANCIDILGDKFGNSRTVERFVNMIILMHASQFSADTLEKIANGNRRVVKGLLTLTMASIPRFDAKTKDFAKNSNRLQLVEIVPEGLAHG